jgi:hypothetical protein
MLLVIELALLAAVINVFVSVTFPFLGPILVAVFFGVVMGKVCENFHLNRFVAWGLMLGYGLPFALLGIAITPNPVWWYTGLIVMTLFYYMGVTLGSTWRSVTKLPQ